jgi:hypothetical protein
MFSSSTTASRKSTFIQHLGSQLTGISDIGADLTYLNFVVGVVVMFFFIPVQTWFYARDRKIHGLPRDRLAVPNYPPLVRIHQQRKDILLVPCRRWRNLGFCRSTAVVEHVELHHW